MKTPSVGVIAAVGAAALLAAGCGSNGKSSNAKSAAANAAGAVSMQTSTSPGASGGASATGTMMTVKRAGKLGAVLAAGPKRMTVYLFEADKGSTSKCSGACASAWPPVTTNGSPIASGGARTTDLGMITRTDGTSQVTYKGHPLYYFVRDKDAGDAYGEGVVGFGASWYAVGPSGSKVDNS